jgi:TolB protein
MPSLRAATAVVPLVALLACGGGGGGPAGGGTPSGGSSAATPDPVDPSPLGATGTIAYARGSELRVVEPDGTGDRLVWAAPPIPGQQTTYTVRGAAWRPDGGEIAFTSDHEEAFSPYDEDVYAIRPDGKALRKITNGPTRERMATFPKGAVRIRVENDTFDYGPYFVILHGAEPKMQTIAPGAAVTLTFEDVADLGPGIQPIVVATGAGRELGVSGADVVPGQTVDSVPFAISGSFHRHGARDPFWRSDGSAIGYFGGLCLLERISAAPRVGFSYDPLVSTDAFSQTCGGEWGPTAATADELLLADGSAGDGAIAILRVREGATTKPDPVVRVQGFHTPDLHWKPDGSGFYVATRASLVEPMQIFEHTFGAGLTQLTDVQLAAPADEIRRFAVSPDGRRIVFERTNELFEGSLDVETDLWIMDRDGSNARLLVAGGTHPAWNPTR